MPLPACARSAARPLGCRRRRPRPADEKTAIARRYLEPQARGDSGVPDASVEVTDGAMGSLIEEYCR